MGGRMDRVIHPFNLGGHCARIQVAIERDSQADRCCDNGPPMSMSSLALIPSMGLATSAFSFAELVQERSAQGSGSASEDSLTLPAAIPALLLVG